MYVCIYVCVYACVCVRTFIYIYIHVYGDTMGVVDGISSTSTSKQRFNRQSLACVNRPEMGIEPIEDGMC